MLLSENEDQVCHQSLPCILSYCPYDILSCMNINIPIGPVSVNKSLKGRKFKSAEYLQFEKDVCLLLPFNKGQAYKGELFCKYVFYIKNYGNADTGNCLKLIEDILVKREYLVDDRYVKTIYLQKERVENIKDEKIVIDIVPYDKRHVLLS